MEVREGIQVNGRHLNNIRCAYDTVLFKGWFESGFDCCSIIKQKVWPQLEYRQDKSHGNVEAVTR